MREGYLVLALDKQKYVEMARILALSIKRIDRNRPVALLYNDAIDLASAKTSAFDDLIHLSEDGRYVGVMNRFRIFTVTPFDRTMVVDADCVMIKPNVDHYWPVFRGHPFNLLGNKVTTGYFYHHDVSRLCKQFSLPYIVKGNAGVFYFEQSTQSEAIFSYMDTLCLHHRESLSRIHQGRAGQYATEPIIGAAMGAFGIEPLRINNDIGSLVVTTWRARRCRFDIYDGVSYLEKPIGFYFGIPLSMFAKGWVAHSPIFAHFIGLRPISVYRDLSMQLTSAGTV